MNIEIVMERFQRELEKGRRLPHVKKPFAYALYHIWRWVDQYEPKKTTDHRTPPDRYKEPQK